MSRLGKTQKRPPPLEDSHGFGLIEAVMIVAIVGILGVIVTKMSANSVRTQTHMKVKDEKMNLTRDLLYLLRDRNQCVVNFANIVVHDPPTETTNPVRATLVYQDEASVNHDFIGDTAGTPPSKQNNIYNTVLKITKVRLVGPYRKNAVAGPGQFRGAVDLKVDVESQIKANANSNFQISIPIAVELATDGSNRIDSCVAIGYNRGSPWTLNPDGTLFFDSAMPVYLGSNTTYNALNPPHNPKLIVATNAPGPGPGGSNVLATQFLHRSDRRLKKNITTNSRTQELLNLSGYDFLWRASQAPDTGILAQELNLDFPELVGSGAKGGLTVNSLALVAPLIEATKTLESQLERRRRLHTKLQKRVSELEAQISKRFAP